MTINEMIEKRANAFEELKALVTRAREAGRTLNAEEREQYDRMNADIDGLKAQIEAEERVNALDAELREIPEKAPRTETANLSPAEVRETPEYRDAFFAYVRGGNFDRRDLEAGDNAEGGYTVPTDFERSVIEKLQQLNVMRQLGTVMTLPNLRKFAVEDSLGSHAYVGEEVEASTGSDVSFGQVELDAYKAHRLVKVSEELLQDTFFDLEGYLARKFATSLANLEETSFTTGSGSGAPQGVTVGASAGVTFAATNTITADELFDLFHSLKRQYRGNASWLLNDATIKAIRQLVINSETNNFVWQPGLQAGQPDSLLGRPVFVGEAMPTMAASNVSAVFGDFSYFWIADRGNQAVQRLNELYSELGQIGFRHIARHDSVVTIGEAIKAGTQAAS